MKMLSPYRQKGFHLDENGFHLGEAGSLALFSLGMMMKVYEGKSRGIPHDLPVECLENVICNIHKLLTCTC